MTRSKSVLRSAAAMAVLLLGEAAAFQSGPAAGPLQKHPTNPRYFTDGSGRAVYLTGSHVWNNAQDGQWAIHLGHPGAFDNAQYLAFLQNYKHNFIRLWTPENASNVDVPSGTLISPVPYVRTGPGAALDGQPKFNLNQFDQAYFDRVRQRVIAARDRGIYVSVMLFDGWGIGGYTGNSYERAWRGHPFHPSNNINGINGDPNGDGRGLEVHSLQIPAITSCHQAFIRKLVDTVNDLDNVLYEISNESFGSGTKDWQYSLINYIKSYEAGKPRRHPVGMTAFVDGAGGWSNNEALFSSPADWISPHSAGDPNLMTNPPAATGAKVILLDTDHLWGVGGDRTWVWKSFARGYNPLFMDPIHFGQPNSVGQSFVAQTAGILTARAAQGHTRTYADRMNLAAMTPQNGLSSTTYCLAAPGSEYLVYQPTGGAFTVNLSAGNYSVEWFNPASGAASAAGTATAGGGNLSFAPPFAGDAVLYLKSSAPPPPPGPAQLIGHWKLDENGGTTAADSSGLGNAGTLMNGASWTGGKLGSAVALDGVDDHIKINPSASLNGVTNRLTMSAWVYRNVDQPGDRLVLSRQQGLSWSDQYFLGFHDNAYMAGVQTTSGYSVVIVGAAPNAQWIHLAATYDGATLRLYVNGSLIGSKAATGNIVPDPSRPLILGAGQNDGTSAVQEAVSGRIDDVRLHTYALSDAEIQTLAGGTPPLPPGDGMGLLGEYFDNADFTALRVSRTDPSVNFDWGLGSPDPALGPDTFSVRWTGQVEAPVAGTFTFYTVADDGVRLWVNGSLLVNQWILQGATEWSGSIALSAGQKVPIRMEYFENGGDAVSKLLWSGPGIPKQVLPSNRLYSSPPSAPSELIGHWKLDEGAGAVASDSSGKGNSGSLLNGAAWASGRLGSAAAFDGVDDHIKVNPSASLNGVTNRLTMSAWVYRNVDQPGDRLVLSRQQGLSWSDQYFLGFHDNAYMAGVQTTSGYSVVIVGAAPNAQWIHLAATYDGATLRLYVNGSLIGSKAATGNIVPDPSRPLILGAGQNDGTSAVQEAVSGRIDDARLYTRALSAAEIQALASGAP